MSQHGGGALTQSRLLERISKHSCKQAAKRYLQMRMAKELLMRLLNLSFRECKQIRVAAFGYHIVCAGFLRNEPI